MNEGGIAFSDAQLQAILATLKSLKSGGVHWDIFLSAFSAMIAGTVVGVVLEYFKSWHERAKSARERLEREAGQINAVIVGIAYNIETLLHAVMQNIIPHHQQSHHAYAALQEAKSDGERIRQFALSLSGYTSLMMTCPEPYIIETDFLNKLTFIVDKDAEFVKKTCWIIDLSQILKTAIRDRNKYIEMADRQKRTQGGLNFYELDSILHIQASIANSECVTTLQLLEKLLGQHVAWKH